MSVINIREQLYLFMLSGGMGFLLSLVYDFFKIIRLSFIRKRPAVFFWDVFYFLVVTFFTFSFLLVANKGEIRWFIMLGELVGFLCCRVFISSYIVAWAIAVLKAEKAFIKIFLRIFFAPFKMLWRVIRRIPRVLVKSNKKNEEIST